MKNQKNDIGNLRMLFIINIDAKDWQVSRAASVMICQQPAQILPRPLPIAPRYPQPDVWRLRELFLSVNQKPF